MKTNPLASRIEFRTHRHRNTSAWCIIDGDRVIPFEGKNIQRKNLENILARADDLNEYLDDTDWLAPAAKEDGIPEEPKLEFQATAEDLVLMANSTTDTKMLLAACFMSAKRQLVAALAEIHRLTVPVASLQEPEGDAWIEIARRRSPWKAQHLLRDSRFMFPIESWVLDLQKEHIAALSELRKLRSQESK